VPSTTLTLFIEKAKSGLFVIVFTLLLGLDSNLSVSVADWFNDRVFPFINGWIDFLPLEDRPGR